MCLMCLMLQPPDSQPGVLRVRRGSEPARETPPGTGGGGLMSPTAGGFGCSRDGGGGQLIAPVLQCLIVELPLLTSEELTGIFILSKGKSALIIIPENNDVPITETSPPCFPQPRSPGEYIMNRITGFPPRSSSLSGSLSLGHSR